MLVSPIGIRLEFSLRLSFQASTNKAKYEELVAGLRVAKNLGAEEVEIFLDSRPVTSQVEGSFKARYP